MTLLSRISFLVSILVFTFFSCIPPEKKELTDVHIDLKDSIYRKILDFQDQRLTDSLVEYFSSDNPSYRYASVYAMASVQDNSVCDQIAERLHDNISEVRAAAAYALGQIGNMDYQDSLISVFGQYDTLKPNNHFNENILEAIGRIGDDNYLKLLATIKGYRPTDTLLILGQTKGLYRYITRGKSVPAGTERILDLVNSKIYSKEIRELSSYYLVRAKKEDLNNYVFRLNNLFKKEKNPVIQMNLAIALGKTQNDESLKALKEVLDNDDKPTAVKVNIINAFGNFEYIKVAETVIKYLEDDNQKVAYAAANYLYNFGEPNDVIIYRRSAKKNLPWIVNSRLYAAILKLVPIYFSKTKSASIWEIKKKLANSENAFEKAAYIRALGEDISMTNLIYESGFKAPETVVRTASMEALATMVKKQKILKLSKWRLKKFKEGIKNIILEAFKSGDVGLIASAVDVLTNSVVDFKQEFEDLDFIAKGKSSLVLPKDIEAYNAVGKLENKWLNKTYKPFKIKYNNPIDWKVFDKLAEKPMVSISTNKGKFTVELYKNESPGSVVNFVKLIDKKFFEGKKFHRVVPNFVVQTGGTRGDGYGSLNYTIRSELTQIEYNSAGMVGMASAGKDTESTQWFVTLAPAPHLDGRYTVFGKVIEGENVLDKIEIGDIIEEVALLK